MRNRIICASFIIIFLSGFVLHAQEKTEVLTSSDKKKVIDVLYKLNEKIHKILKARDITYKTITLKIRFQGFETHTRSFTLPIPSLRNEKKSMNIILRLLHGFSYDKRKIRLIGIKFSNITPLKFKQTTLLQCFPKLNS